MTSTVVLSHQLNEATKKFQWKGPGVKGFLIGPDFEPFTVVAVWHDDVVDINNVRKSIDDCLTHFPCGKSVTGIILMSTSTNSGANVEQDLVSLFGSLEALLDHFDHSSLLVLCLHKANTTEPELETSFVSVTKSGIKPTQLDVSTYSNPFVGMRLRLKAEVPLLLSFTPDNSEEWKSQLSEKCSTLVNCLLAGGSVFGFDGNRVLVHKGGVTMSPDCKTWKLVKDIRKYLKDVDDEREEKVFSSTNKGIQSPIDVSMLLVGSGTNKCPSHAPIIAHSKGTFSSVQLQLPIDILVEVKDDLTVQKLYTMLIESVSRQISALSQCLEAHSQSEKFCIPEVFHSKPTCLDTPVSMIYPREVADESLENERLLYHDRLLMSKDKPYLRKGCADIFLNPTAPGGYLVNPHIGLNIPQSVKNGIVCTVWGCYSYHHYMQDRFNDDKWGCAYRSLQTIVSWFKYQGYTSKNIPSHREIQQALHDCGDKGEKFVGSRQWIGSFEVSFVLDHLLSVSSKFINVNSGSELSTTGQQLLSHFQTQGTPVMIGGGVLAHTILGVAYDQMTGDIAFLILDPHYTGGEDLKTIQDKGWCGWKDMKFWDQTAHYNMCLPQTPVMV